MALNYLPKGLSGPTPRERREAARVRRAMGALLGWVSACSMVLGTPLWAADTSNFGVTIQVQEIAELQVIGSVSSPMTISTAPDAGSRAADATDNNQYLQYTSTVPSGKTRKITAALIAGTLPAGTRLYVFGSSPSGGGAAGAVGNSAGTVTLTSTDKDLMTGIGACKTGTTPTSGARLTYTFRATSWLQVRASAAPTNVTVRFTLTDAQ